MSDSRSDRQPAARSAVGEGSGLALGLTAGVADAPEEGSEEGAGGEHASSATVASVPRTRIRAIGEILRRRSIVGNPCPI